MKADILTMDAATAGSIELDDAVYGLEPRADILHRMVRYQQAKKQSGTHSCKIRSEITATRKKMYKQKGTGGARHGDKKASQFRGGAKVFGPRPRSHAIDLPKKVRKLALKHALSAKAKANELVIVDKVELDQPKTSELKKKLEALSLGSVLMISGDSVDANVALAARNIKTLDVLPVQGINVYDILRREKLVLTKDAVSALEARFK